MKTTAPLLAVAVVIAAVVAALAGRETPAPRADLEPVLAPGAAWGTAEEAEGTDAAEGADNAALHGQVLETVDVAEYTYLRLSTPSGEVWTAVSKVAVPVPVGSSVNVLDAARMENFQSATLKRTFPVIYFGRLGDAGAQALPAGHPAIADQNAAPPGHPTARAAASSTIPEVAVKPAAGKNAHVIAELYGSRERLQGQTVRVSGQVVKVTTGVLGKNYLRIRDGSSTSPDQRELVVTTLASTPLGDVVTLRGTLQTDVDVGIGYKYAVLLADAELEPSL
jgi:hypothetical protein